MLEYGYPSRERQALNLIFLQNISKDKILEHFITIGCKNRWNSWWFESSRENCTSVAEDDWMATIVAGDDWTTTTEWPPHHRTTKESTSTEWAPPHDDPRMGTTERPSSTIAPQIERPPPMGTTTTNNGTRIRAKKGTASVCDGHTQKWKWKEGLGIA